MLIAATAFAIASGCEKSAPSTNVTAPPPQPGLFDDAPPATQPATLETARGIRFEDMTASAGIAFRHDPHRTTQKYMPEIMGSGVVIADFNRDGAPDIVLVNSGNVLDLDATDGRRNRLYINDGKGTFSDQTDAWQLADTRFGMGASAGDFDNDGWPDLLLTGWGGPVKLMRNTGKSSFEDVTQKVGLPDATQWSTSGGFFDMDADGDLDLMVVYYLDYSIENAIPCYIKNIHTYCGPLQYKGTRDRLYRNNGDMTFTEVTQEAGIPDATCNGLALGLSDVDSDGDVDIYVANDETRNFLLLNDGKGTFTDIGSAAGVAYSDDGDEESGMGVDYTDLNKDRRLEIAVTNFQQEPTSIYQGHESGAFYREVSDAVGVGASSRARLSFGIDFFDPDNDGDEDLLVANGHIQDAISAYSSLITFEQQNSLYENRGDGTLLDVSNITGDALTAAAVSRGLATGELNGDGLIDFVVNNNGGTAQLGINRTERPGGFVNLWLEGVKSNRSAIGARVTAAIGDDIVERQVVGSSSYLSLCDLRVHIGLSEATQIDTLEIRWPSGLVQTIEALPGGKYYHIVEGETPAAYVPGAAVIAP